MTRGEKSKTQKKINSKSNSTRKGSKELEKAQNLLKFGSLRFEKCELKEAYEAFLSAYEFSKKNHLFLEQVESLCGLIRFFGESLQLKEMEKHEKKLDQLLARKKHQNIPVVWYTKGIVASYFENWSLSKRCFMRFLKASRRTKDAKKEFYIARAILGLANVSRQIGHIERSKKLAHYSLAYAEGKNLRGINGVAYLTLGFVEEKQKKYTEAQNYYQKAHQSFLSEHNWYHYLYVLYGYARIARVQLKYSRAYWYLDLIDKAASGEEFGLIRRELKREKKQLENDAVDLLINGQEGYVQTRENDKISFRKQYVLLEILKELSKAHRESDEDSDRGLSKAEIIKRVWKENYRPEAHDNKLYYNINRLRKLIEPDVKHPQYLLNWKEGYRLSPGLRVQFLESMEKFDNKSS